MAENYRIKYKKGDFEIEVESSDKTFVEKKLNDLISDQSSKSTPKYSKKVGTSESKITPKTSNMEETENVSENNNENGEIDVVNIVNAIHDSDKYDIIDSKILKKSNQLNRILMVFYFVHQVYGNNKSINSGNIEAITDQLGVRIQQPNVSKKIKANSKFFAGDSVRKKGSVVNYKINRKGLDEFEKIISN